MKKTPKGHDFSMNYINYSLYVVYVYQTKQYVPNKLVDKSNKRVCWKILNLLDRKMCVDGIFMSK